ncbi:MAG: hypothetical protein FJ398_24395 [Verrucomicrobia bacterium]|nr:hypothetical protein [Verrucomicrobiota bacterium]
MKLPRCFLFLWVVTGSLAAQERTATLIGYCRSVYLHPAQDTVLLDQFPIYFTTFDGLSDRLPLYDFTENRFLFSGELRPSTGFSEDIYMADFIRLSDEVKEWGSFSLSIPFQDKNTNGIPDIVEAGGPQLRQASTASFVSSWPNNSQRAFAGIVFKETGTSGGVFQFGGSRLVNIAWNALRLEGQVSYDPLTRIAKLRLSLLSPSRQDFPLTAQFS